MADDEYDGQVTDPDPGQPHVDISDIVVGMINQTVLDRLAWVQVQADAARESTRVQLGKTEEEFKVLEREAMERLQARLARSLAEFDRFTKGEKGGVVEPGRDH